MDNKLYRINEFVRPADGRSLVVDTSAGLILGAPPGLERFAPAVEPVLPLADGLVTSPGQARRLSGRTRADAALLIRAGWTNALRGADFVLPPETIFHIPLLDPADALDLGASALVAHVLLGHDEDTEAGCLREIVQLALTGTPLGLPLIADVQPIGPRVVLHSKAIELGVSYSVECGADGVVIPWPGADSLRTILTMAAGLPVWVRAETLDPADAALNEALSLGATGLWLDARVFASADPAALVTAFRALVHGSVPEPV
ncbi:MAG: hypothetical protein KJ047_04345 [Anaerolineae bacterium]|nr:hypothetical protein [Anaerolineae bacterium]MEB2289282.1 hypothetical protein [Anaerolineae bacterium]